MRTWRWTAPLLVLLLSSASATAARPRPRRPAAPAPAATPAPGTQYESFPLHSPAIAESKLGDDGDVKLHVLLPPSYAREPERRYPVVYFLPGFDESPRQVDEWVEAFDQAFAAWPGREFVLVALEGRNVLGGAFYVNGPATGRWEDFVAVEAVRAVDARYRTIPAAASRGLFGFSMGGFGVLHVGLRHPDVFGAVMATGPGVLAPGGLAGAMASWASSPRIKPAYGAAFAPDLGAEKPYARVPDLASPADAALVARWEAGFGGWPGRLDAYHAQPARLARIRLEVGSFEMYGWILEGTRYLHELMQARGLPVEFGEFPGGHEIRKPRLSATVVPFFQANLAWTAPPPSDPFAYDASARLDARALQTDRDDATEVQHLTLSSPAMAREVDAWLVRPRGPGPFPAVLFLHAYPGSNRLFLDEARALAQKGVASLLVEGLFPWHRRPEGLEEDRAAIGQQVVELRRALDFLTSRPDVDRRRIAYVGMDYGAVHGALLASLDARFAGVVLVVPTATYEQWNSIVYREPMGEAYQRGMADLDPVGRIGKVSAPLLLQFAAGDVYVARETAERLARAARSPTEVRWYEGPHEAPRAAGQRDREEWLLQWLGAR